MPGWPSPHLLLCCLFVLCASQSNVILHSRRVQQAFDTTQPVPINPYCSEYKTPAGHVCYNTGSYPSPCSSEAFGLVVFQFQFISNTSALYFCIGNGNATQSCYTNGPVQYPVTSGDQSFSLSLIADGVNYSITNSSIVNVPVTHSDHYIVVVDSQSDLSVCSTNDTGYVVVTAYNGDPRTQYHIGDPVLSTGNALFTNLSAGSHTIYATAGNCSSSTNVNITLIPIQISCFVSYASCTTANFNYSITGATSPSTTVSFNGKVIQNRDSYFNVSAGDYTISVLDRNVCKASALCQVRVFGVSSLTQPSCGRFGGAIILAADHGYQPYNYSITGQMSSFNDNGNFSNLPAGDYQFFVQDSRGCSTSAAVAAGTGGTSVPLQLTVRDMGAKVVPDVSNRTCARAGVVTLRDYNIVKGKLTVYSLNGIDYQTNTTFTGLVAGDYTWYASNSVCNTTGDSVFSVTTNPEIKIDLKIATVQCGSYADVTIIPTGANGTLLYNLYSPNLSLSQYSPFFPNLRSSNYAVTVTDPVGCSATERFAVQLARLNTTAAVINNRCAGTARASLAASGGSPPYLFSFNHSDFSLQTIYNISSGYFLWSVQDASGCLFNQTQSYIFPSRFSIFVMVTRIGCNGTLVEVSPVGGSSPFTIKSNGTAQRDLVAHKQIFLPLGVTLLEAQDANGCIFQQTLDVEAPRAEFKVTSMIANGTCATNATLTLQAHGDSAPFSYSFAGEALQDQNQFNGSEGTIDWLVQDSSGCQVIGHSMLVSECSVPLQPDPPLFISQYYSVNASNSIQVYWDDRAHTYTDRYHVLQMKQDEVWASVYIGMMNQYLVENLQSYTTFYFRLAKGNSAGLSNYSIVSHYKTAGVPGSSAITFPEYTRSQITISWRVSDDGGMQMSNWTIFFSSYNATWNIISFPANTSQNKFLGLNASTVYYFQVQATNIYGSGPISNAQVFATADPMCGDGTCDANETCSECHFDCCDGVQPTEQTTCPGSPIACSNNGVCTRGVCKCTGVWSGPDCSTNGTLPIIVVLNNGSGIDIGITPNNQTQDQVKFNILIQLIQEVDQNDNIITSISLGSFDHAALVIQTVVLPDNSTYVQYSYSFNLSNNATVSILLLHFTTSQSLAFAGQEVDIPSNGMKYSLIVDRWPFTNIRNRLSIGMQPTATNIQNEGSTKIETNDGATLLWFAITTNGLKLYGQFMDYALIDDDVRLVEFTYNKAQGKIVLMVPFFWTKAVIDPQFHVLLDGSLHKDDARGKKHDGLSKLLIIAVAVAVSIAIITAAVLYYIYKQKSLKTATQLGRRMMKTCVATPYGDGDDALL